MTENTKDGKIVFTVSQVNEYVKQIIDATPIFNSIYVKGEISNFTNHRTGHLYFSLKDEGGLIRSVMFKFAAQSLKFKPENGMKILAHGRISAFPRDGQYQLYVDSMEPDGVGALYIAYEQLKEKLRLEGLFDDRYKKALPKIPTRIGIITSPTGAAIRDILNILGRRFPYAKAVLYPALVQGDGAPAQLINGLEFFNSSQSVDVIIIGRGGGSIEDLWAFNDEGLARAVFASDIPVISAVGHETDFTICDFVADMRAPTPSAAAELAVPENEELKRKIGNIVGRMELLISSNIENGRMRVGDAGRRNDILVSHLIQNAKARLKDASDRRVLKNPIFIVEDRRMEVINLEKNLDSAMKYHISQKKHAFGNVTSKLEMLNPMSVISRGYSAVFDEGGTLIKSVDQLKVGDTFNFKTVDGKVTGNVKGIVKNGN